MARPATGRATPISSRVPPWVAEELEEIATREGLTLSALVARIATRYVENYPLDDVDR